MSRKRFPSAALQNLQKIISMCGDAGCSKVIIGTTEWQSTAPGVAQSHQNELESVHWGPMIQKGIRVLQFHDNRDSAIKFVEAIVRSRKPDTLFTGQSVLHVDDKTSDTDIGKQEEVTPRQTLKKMLERQRELVDLLARGAVPYERMKLDKRKEKK